MDLVSVSRMNLLQSSALLLGGVPLPVLPTLYDWKPLNSEPLPGGSIFTRASIAEEYDGTDFTEVGSGVIREDSVAAFGGAKGFLSEPAATNLCLESSDYNTLWTVGLLTITNNGVGAIGLVEHELAADSGNGNHRIFLSEATTGTRTTYVIAKNGTGRYVALRSGNIDNTDYAVFDLQLGTITETGSNAVSRMTSLGNGYYKCEITNPTNPGGFMVVSLSDTGTPGTGDPIFDASGSETILLDHVQLEDTAFSTTPIVTNGSTVTRVADVLDAGVAIPTEFGARFDFTAPAVVGTGNTISLLGAAVSAVDILRLDASFNVIMDDGGTPVTIGTVAANQRFKVSYGRDAAGRSGSLNGATAVTGDAPSAAHEGENFHLYCTAGADQARGIGHISTIYSVKPTDEELKALSA